MKFTETRFRGLYVVETFLKSDTRGKLCKTYNEDSFHKGGVFPEFKEFLYTVTGPGVIRGMHFQTPPYEQDKLVFVIKGSVVDVVVDLRKDSVSYGEYFDVELTDKNGRALYVPKGFAHGFKSLCEENIVGYLITSVFSEEHDGGIRWDSFGYEWNFTSPILSDKDKNLEPLEEFDSPF